MQPVRSVSARPSGVETQPPSRLGIPEERTANSAWDDLQYRFLRRFIKRPLDTGSQYVCRLEQLLGSDIFDRLAGKRVVDFGCGHGGDAVEMAKRGAREVVGVDIREEVLAVARERADAAGVQYRCTFARSADAADAVVSVDAFEHFSDPAGMLNLMYGMLREGGEALISFGPTWYHPLGGHLFSVFPWAHLLFSERALIRWRSDFKTDAATRFGEVSGGLNQMTIARFVSIARYSGFKIAEFEAVPIRKLRFLHCSLTREFASSVVRCRLVKVSRSRPCALRKSL